MSSFSWNKVARDEGERHDRLVASVLAPREEDHTCQHVVR